jgi:hypothetical protein
VDYDARILGEINFYFNKIPCYLFSDAGFRLRGGDYQNQGLYRIEFGLSAAPKVNLRFALSGIASFGELNTLIGIGEIPRPAETRPLNVLGDERFGQASIGLQSQVSPTLAFTFDYHKRLYGNATFIGDLIQFTFVIFN